MAGTSVNRRSTRAPVLQRDSRRSTTLLWTTFGVMGVLLVAYLVSLLLRPTGSDWTWLDGWSVCAVELVVSALCIGRGLVRRPGRVTAVVLGISLLMWTLGDMALTVESLGGASPPSPSVADIFYLVFYPFAYIAVVLFIRGEVRRFSTPNWLDGGIAGLGAAAVCAAFAFHSILHSTGGHLASTVTNLAYPIGDLLLLGLVVGGSALLSGRPKAPWVLLAGGLALNVIGDTSNLFQGSWGASRFGSIANATAWPFAIFIMAVAVWLRPRPSNLLVTQRASGFVLPSVAAGSALVVLLVGSVHTVSRVAIGLATATLVVVGIRLVLTVRTMRALSEERQRQSVTDDLTGLRNRRYLFHVLDSFFAESAATPDRNLAFLFVDLNHFKEINDSFGHPAGDELLRQLGIRLAGSLRNNDLLVRIGGDEFAVVLIDGDCDYATTVAQRLTASLEEPFALDVVNAKINASIGIAVAPTDATDSAGLVWCADVAMYRAKLGNTAYTNYEQKLDEERDRMRLLEELDDAITNDHLVLHYQPQLDLRSGEIVAVEALIRWAHPRLGLIAPIAFIPLAEDAGIMPAVTRWVLEEAVAQCAQWRSTGHNLTVSVNISPTNLLEAGFVDMVGALLDRHDVPASSLVLEITETTVIAEFDTSPARYRRAAGPGPRRFHRRLRGGRDVAVLPEQPGCRGAQARSDIHLGSRRWRH